MRNITRPLLLSLLLITCILCVNCTGQQKSPSPRGYDLNNPVKYSVPDELTEISGIAFSKGNPDMVFAEQDEKGDLFYFKPGDKNVQRVKFGKRGDYEDIAIGGNRVIMLRSDGVLYTFPLSGIKSPTVQATEFTNLLPQGEYEGLYADDRSVYVLCKHCSMEKSSKTSTVFSLTLAADGSLKTAGKFEIDVKRIEQLAGKKKVAFHPSALSKNPQTSEWYILSSVNKLLVIADANWNVKEVYPLNPSVFGQPEGMAFDSQNNLYISNEGDKTRTGNILKFAFKK